MPPAQRSEPACDAHIHVVGPADRYPVIAGRTHPGLASLETYRQEMAHTDIRRVVVVQPSFYGYDNSCTLDATDSAGGAARAVVVVPPDIGEAQLSSYHARGARGVRFNIVSGGLQIPDLEAVAARIRNFGWHLQLFVDAAVLPELEPRLRRLGVPLVFDHLAHVDPAEPVDSPGFQVLRAMLGDGVAWAKVSNPFFQVSGQRAQASFAANPERVVWASDWPHVAFQGSAPSVDRLLDDTCQWFPSETEQARLFRANAARLYGF